MTGLPFNPMRKEPPPPPHIDTVTFNALDFLIVRSRDRQEFFVHRECLRESPLLRRAFAKRQDVTLDDLVVTFSSNGFSWNESQLASYDDAGGKGSATFGDEDRSDAGREVGISAIEIPTKLRADGRSASLPFAAAAEETSESPTCTVLKPKSTAPLLVLTETLQVDRSVDIHFPNTNGATLDTIIAYLYYKHRYERKPLDVRKPFAVPSGSAIAVMKIANLLEC